jgi:cell division protein FtsN
MSTSKPELYKDKIEVALDGRQIFYLFFGGAVIVGLVFVLGVVVGRRVEARGHVDAQARTEQRNDPLAALDRLEGKGTTYQGTLTGTTDAPSKVEALIADMAKPKAADKSEKPTEKVADKPIEKPAPAIEEPKAADVAVAEKKHDEPKAESKKHDEPKPEGKPEKKSRYTIQLSSFQDKAEAEAFLSNVKASGYQATLTEAEISGKGTFYRVRLGTYRSLDAATEAKSDYEKSSKKSASIMKL